jgi:phospholipase/carboxylesterase
VIGLSGFIPTVEGFELDLAGRAGLPAFVAHGTHDPVIDVGFGRDARDRLTAAGLAVTYRESPIAHSVDPSILPELQRWLPR